MRRTTRRLVAGAALLAALGACGDDGGAQDQGAAPATAASEDEEPSTPPEDGDSPTPGSTESTESTEPEPSDPPAPTLPALRAEVGRQRVGLVLDGRERAVEAVVPEAALGGPVPLVLLFHGFGQEAAPFLDLTGMEDVARASGWVLLAPDGVDRSFNAGGGERGCCGEALDTGVDDVAFARALVAEVGAVLGDAPSVVVATGFSNGGMLSHRLGCEASDLVDGIVPVSAALLLDGCAPSEPVEVRHLHGSSDLVVPQSRGASAAQQWAEVLGCSAAGTDDGPEGVESSIWTGCDGGVEVRFDLRRRLGHDWPSGPPLGAADLVTEVVEEVAARG